MTITIAHNDATIELAPLGDGRSSLAVRHRSGSISTYITSCPQHLIETVLAAKTPQTLIDELARDEDPLYVRICLEKDLFAYIPREDFRGRRLLDFGCGSGASTMNLARMLPETALVGVDLSEKLLSVARARATHYGFGNITLLRSPSGDALPDGIGTFDFILFSAVYEHLLPAERPALLAKVWSRLKPGGVLFLDQTPWRWFPFEGHTTALPLVNYLPDWLAHFAARMLSKRDLQNESWESLLRSGIRGGSVRQIMNILRKSADTQPLLLKPHLSNIHDRIDLWYAGYAIPIARKYPRIAPLQRAIRILFKAIRCTTGLTIAPSLSLAIRKEAQTT
jgi:2-polyprenyl-3-methyl-5-hydroxy-6-metoxy-1,4-benzoquinol methylase